MTEAGYHVQNKSIEMTIKNQPFTPYTDADGHTVLLYYNVSPKGHFGDYWGYHYYGNYYLSTSDSEYTVIEFGLNGNNGSTPYRGDIWLWDVSAGGQVDFRVQAFLGYSTTIEGPLDPLFHRPTYSTYYTGETGDWSSTQTLTIGESQTPTPSPANSPTPGPQSPQTEIATIVGVVIVAVVLGAALGLLVYLIKRK
jgi:hypothetical protein